VAGPDDADTDAGATGAVAATVEPPDSTVVGFAGALDADCVPLVAAVVCGAAGVCIPEVPVVEPTEPGRSTVVAGVPAVTDPGFALVTDPGSWVVPAPGVSVMRPGVMVREPGLSVARAPGVIAVNGSTSLAPAGCRASVAGATGVKGEV
jgi:hypothetical protein